MTATCPQCEADDLAQGQHFCHHCGATLAHPTVPATANIVGDGSQRAMSLYVGNDALLWAMDHPAGIALFGVSAVFVVAMAAFVVFTAVVLAGAVVAAVIHALPFLLIALLFILVGHGGHHRGGRGRRRSARRGRRNVYWV